MFFLDDDDLLEPGCLATLIKTIAEHGAGRFCAISVDQASPVNYLNMPPDGVSMQHRRVGPVFGYGLN